MTSGVTCSVAANGETPRLYAAGRLEPSELEDFELHLLDCAECQEAVAMAARVGGAVLLMRRRRRFLRNVGLSVAAAAGFVAIVVVSGGDPVQRLGSLIDAPAFTGVPARTGATDASVVADQAVSAYVRRDFALAAELFADVAEQDPQPSTLFYLGAARLVGGDARGALEAFARCLESVGSPYEGEAHFYMAKAWLVVGNTDSALVHLRSATRAQGPEAAKLRSWAAALADSVAAVVR